MIGDDVIVDKGGSIMMTYYVMVVGIIGSGADKKYELKVVEVDKMDKEELVLSSVN